MLHHVESGTGRPVVLLHAFPMDSALWAAQRRALGAEGHRVITPDLPGFGGSAPSPTSPSVDVMADAVVELLDHLGIEQAVVGGLSMGGYVTMALLRRHPDRLSAIVLADTKAGADTPEAAATRETVAAAVEAAGTAAGIADGMLPNLLGATTRESRPDVVATVRRWIGAQPAAGVAWAQRAMAGRPDSRADIAAFRPPGAGGVRRRGHDLPGRRCPGDGRCGAIRGQPHHGRRDPGCGTPDGRGGPAGRH